MGRGVPGTLATGGPFLRRGEREQGEALLRSRTGKALVSAPSRWDVMEVGQGGGRR